MPDAADPSITEFRDEELAYWQRRAHAAEDRIRQAAVSYPDAPPEPPVGTEYIHVASGSVAWRRTDDGWYCNRLGCRNCPVEWVEAWDWTVSRGGYTRRLPGSPERDLVSPERDRHP